MDHSPFPQCRQCGLQVDGSRRGQRTCSRGNRLVRAVEGAQGADAAGALISIQEMADESGGGGFSIGAGDTDQGERAPRMLIPRSAEYLRGAAAVSNHDFGYTRLLRSFDNDGGGSPSNRIGDEAMPICL